MRAIDLAAIIAVARKEAERAAHVPAFEVRAGRLFAIRGDDAVDLGDVRGPAGLDGESIKGDRGDKGDRGADGRDGVSIKGDRGDKGDPGDRGVKGDKGQTGADGRGIAGASVNAAGHLIITFTDGTTQDAGKVRGEDGKRGAPGKDGAPGKSGKFSAMYGGGGIGLPGPAGPQGPQGEPGPAGADGTISPPTIPAFTSLTGQSAATLIQSDAVTISGDAGSVWPVTVRGNGSPEIQLSGGAWSQSAAAIPGDTVRLRLTSGAIGLVERTATIYAPGVSATWSVTTTAFGWTPEDLTGVSIWLDAADAGTITLDGSGVSAWSNLGSASVSITAPGSLPTYDVDGMIGEPTVDFDGVQNFLASNATISTLMGTNDFAVFALGRADTSSTNSADGFANEGFFGDVGGYVGMYVRSSGAAGAYAWDGTGKTAQTAYTIGNNAIFHMQLSGGSVRMRVNGGAEAATACGAITVGGGLVRFGLVYLSPTTCLDGAISEFLIVKPAPSDADRQRIEGYLAHKWGLTASLPVDHPYKDAAP